MEQVPGPDPLATVRCTVRWRGCVVGQFYAHMTMEAWFQIVSRPFVHTGDIHQASLGDFTNNFEWIGRYQTLANL